MNQIESRVVSARRRLIFAQFGRNLCWTLFAAILVAVIAIAMPAIAVMEVDFSLWTNAWLIAAGVLAVLAAAVHAIATAPSKQAVAAEVDRRFGLRERLSSSISLDADSRNSDFGLALVNDAEEKAAKIELAEKFSLQPTRLGWLPISLIPVLVIVLALLEPAVNTNAGSTPKIDIAEVTQVKAAATQLKKRIQQQKRKASAEGLKEAEELFEKMEADLDKIAKRENMDRKEAMIALNDLKKQLEERREQLGSSEQMRRVMSQMKGLESGPADKVAKSIEKGEFGKAKDLVKQLANKMRDGKLSEEEKSQLKKQVAQMKDRLEKAVKEHEKKKQELQQKIDQARKEGRGEDAAKMQQKMNEMSQKDGQMQQMQKMAEAMSQAQQAMQQGDAGQAADAMEQMADQLGEMQQEMSELEDLQSALDDLSQSKNQMRCESCGGAGCQQCQGGGMGGMGDGQGQGDGLGKGSGSGDRPEDEVDTNTYETQVRGKVKKGKAIIAGFADGPNRKGITQEDVKQSIEAALSKESDPSENQTLPRSEREHAQQYFDRLRDGK
ncbi:putative membrane protein [Rhodopirellula maiorica SM1]|uniref:Putative membrane protein n=1 Tax=Rhodopirellula maiorica SM1 TaxID=1265738 RepID=M5RMQ4_9BACT|nr:putative membrane protein [Rhodopirellula maiorica]EMI16667.1 putative membrane protein [Rhodopirellula maiorica SM1]